MQRAAFIDFADRPVPTIEKIHNDLVARIPDVERLVSSDNGATWQLGSRTTSLDRDMSERIIVVLVSYPETALETALIEIAVRHGGKVREWKRGK
ncbi:MAG: exo-alpha-sialidase [Myxococcales bacterium]|nr:exo-alpha-sialidase [Myxococcales bacterium]